MIKEILSAENKTFTLPSVLYKAEDVFVYKLKKIAKEDVAEARFIYEQLNYENDKPVHVVREMADLGYFDGLFSNKAVRVAKKRGILPEGYQIHHIVPLKLGGSNSVKNLCVVDQETHAMLHQLIYQPIIDKMQLDEEAVLILPPFERVIKKEDRAKFFLFSELRKHALQEAKLITHHKKENINADMGFRDAYCRSRRMR
ncbi:MAG: HNH endonuclease [Alphaproteobacteria bacterium]|nr:HNH endonuclease [Alphaproteobacteria bacterium]MBR6729961.1 HNH endonuclease [Alphaproteobacteria bacterium]